MPSGMPRIEIDISDDEEVVPIPVDRRTRSRLVRLAGATGKHPSEIASALLREVLEDDEIENGPVTLARRDLN